MQQKQNPADNWGQCEICGNIVVLSAYDVCYRCRGTRELQYQKIMDFLKDHRGANVNTVAEATGVEARLVLKLMQRGSIKVWKGVEKNKCASCGRPVEMGRYCKDCGRMGNTPKKKPLR